MRVRLQAVPEIQWHKRHLGVVDSVGLDDIVTDFIEGHVHNGLVSAVNAVCNTLLYGGIGFAPTDDGGVESPRIVGIGKDGTIHDADDLALGIRRLADFPGNRDGARDNVGNP